MGFYQWFDKQDKVIKAVLLIPFWGWIFSFLYRLDKFLENRDVASLIGWILALVIGFVVSIIDLITVITEDKIMFLVSGGENFGINGTVDSFNENDKKDDNTVNADYSEVKEENKESKEELLKKPLQNVVTFSFLIALLKYSCLLTLKLNLESSKSIQRIYG